MKFKDKHPFLAYSVVRIPHLIAIGFCMYLVLAPFDNVYLSFKQILLCLVIALCGLTLGNIMYKKVGFEDDFRK